MDDAPWISAEVSTAPRDKRKPQCAYAVAERAQEKEAIAQFDFCK